MTTKHGYDFRIRGQQGSAVGYLIFPAHPGIVPGVVRKSLRLRDAAGAYDGPDVSIHFDKDNRLIGIEIVE